MCCMRRIARIVERESNKRGRITTTRYKQVLQTIKQKKLQYYGHIRRKSNFLTTLLKGKTEGRRPKGRPRQTWFSNIPQWTGRDAKRCVAEATDRHL